MNLISLISFAAALAQSSISGPQLLDAQVTYKIDDVITSVSSTKMQGSDYFVPIIEATPIFSHLAAACVPDGDGVDIQIRGKTTVHIGKLVNDAQLYDPAKPGVVMHSWPVYAYLTPDPKSPDVFWVEVRTLCDLLGNTVEIEKGRATIYTPKLWASRIGLNGDEAEIATIGNIAWMPAAGVTPPGSNMLVWVRPEKDAKELFAQIYDVSGPSPRPQLGIDASGHIVEHLISEERLRSVRFESPLQMETQALKTEDHMSFAFVVLRSDPMRKSALAAIVQGDVLPSEYIVFGIRQKTAHIGRDFSRRSITKEISLKDFASQVGHTEGLLADLNGFRSDDILEPGEKIIIPDHWEKASEPAKAAPYQFEGTCYDVKLDDTLEGLAKRWRVKPDWIIAANSQQLSDGQLHNEYWINKIGPIPTAPDSHHSSHPNPGVTLTANEETRGSLLRPTKLTKEMDPTKPGKMFVKGMPLIIKGEARSVGMNLYWVSINDELGYVPMDSVKLKPTPKQDVAAANKNPITTVALKYLGVPYHFGSANIHQEHRIDCSHFVAEVFEEAGVKNPPEAPVHNQESNGKVVHFRGVEYERAGDYHGNAPSENSLDQLRTGDRIIIQIDPKKDVPGWHHTGIYIGPLYYGGHQYLHAVIHAGQPKVQITELTDRRLWSHYRFSVRSEGLPQ